MYKLHILHIFVLLPHVANKLNHYWCLLDMLMMAWLSMEISRACLPVIAAVVPSLTLTTHKLSIIEGAHKRDCARPIYTL